MTNYLHIERIISEAEAFEVLFGKVIHIVQENFGKRHKKAFGKAWNQRSLAEGKANRVQRMS